MLDSRPLRVLSSGPSPLSPSSPFIDPRDQGPNVLLFRTQESQIPGPFSPRLQDLGPLDPGVWVPSLLLLLWGSRSQPKASPVPESFRLFPSCVYMQGQPPDLHFAPAFCGGPALLLVQVPIPGLAMTLAASSQRSQIIRSKFRSGERLLSVLIGKGCSGSGECSNSGSVQGRVRLEGG